jgi:hypothetical protein
MDPSADSERCSVVGAFEAADSDDFSAEVLLLLALGFLVFLLIAVAASPS